MKINNIEFKEDKSVEVSALRIGPEQAKIAIANMTKNQRHLGHGKVREYVKEMLGGRWSVSNDAAVICDGEWLNANHRLHAIVESGTEQTLLVLTVLDNSILRIMDGGKPRRVSDVVVMETGTEYSKDVVSISTLVLAYKKKLLSSGGSNLVAAGNSDVALKRLVTRQDKIEFAIKNQPHFLSAAQTVRPLFQKYGLIQVSIGGAAFHLVKEKDGEGAALKYITGIYSGEAMDGAQKQLRQFFIKQASTRAVIPQAIKFGMVLKAYISSRNGTIPGQLMLKSNEDFPEI